MLDSPLYLMPLMNFRNCSKAGLNSPTCVTNIVRCFCCTTDIHTSLPHPPHLNQDTQHGQSIRFVYSHWHIGILVRIEVYYMHLWEKIEITCWRNLLNGRLLRQQEAHVEGRCEKLTLYKTQHCDIGTKLHINLSTGLHNNRKNANETFLLTCNNFYLTL